MPLNHAECKSRNQTVSKTLSPGSAFAFNLSKMASSAIPFEQLPLRNLPSLTSARHNHSLSCHAEPQALQCAFLAAAAAV